MSETIATCIDGCHLEWPNVLRPLRVPMAVVAALVVAEAAVLLLRPREGVIAPAPVELSSYFSAAEIDRARDFRRPQLALYGGALLVDLAVLGVLLARPSRRLRGPLRRPVLVAA